MVKMSVEETSSLSWFILCVDWKYDQDKSGSGHCLLNQHVLCLYDSLVPTDICLVNCT